MRSFPFSPCRRDVVATPSRVRRISDRASVLPATLVLISFLFLSLIYAYAQTTSPANDNFASAQVISGTSGTVTGSNIGATRETGEPTHLYAPRVSVWYRWTAPSTGQVVFDTVGSNFDTLLAAYSGTALSALTLQAANDDGPVVPTSEVTFAVTAGTVYQITVDGFVGATGNITLNWKSTSSTSAPPNDNFASAQTLSGTSGTVTGTNIGATKEVGEPAHWNGNEQYSIWYQWTAPASGSAVFTTEGSNFDTVMAVYTGSALNALTLIGKNDDDNGPTSRVSLSAVSGATYRIAVDSYSNGTNTVPGDVSLNWQLTESATVPGAPGAPTFSAISQTGLTVTAPVFPANTTSLALQQKLASEAATAYVNIQEGMAGGATKSVTGLTSGTAYTFRFVAVNATASTSGTEATVTTLSSSTSSIPGAPTFLEVTTVIRQDRLSRDYVTGRVTVQAPALPAGAQRMMLQFRTSAQVDANFTTVTDADTGVLADTLGSGAVTAVEGLRLLTRYVFRYVAVTSAGVQTPGPSGDVVIPDSNTATAPGLPNFSDLSVSGVTVTAPALPEGATSLTLQVRPQSDSVYSVVASSLEGNSATAVTYPTGQRNHYFRFLAVGMQGSVPGVEKAPTTLPEAPVVNGSVSPQSVTFNAPVQTGTTWSALNESTFVLQCKKSGEPDSAYLDWNTGTFNVNPTLAALQLAPGTAYTFRWSISGAGGTANGPSTNVTTPGGTQPGEAGAPTFSNIGPVSVSVTAPSTSLTTLRANRLKLQQRSGTAAWADVADNLSPGIQSTVTGLTPLTTYVFRYLAIASGTPELVTAGLQAAVTTTTAAPETPGVPSFVSATTVDITVTLPPIQAPLRTASLTLQYKLASDPADFVDWGTGHVAGGTSVTVTGLAPGRSYLMRARAHAVVAGQNDTFGGALGTGTAAPAPGTPGAPQLVTIIDPYTVQIKAPALLPSDTDYLKLQILPVSQGTSDWIDLTDGDGMPLPLAPNQITEISGLTPGLTYRFRYAAVGTGGVTPGPAYPDTLMPVTSASWASSASGTIAKTIQCKGIRYPNPAGGAVTVARGAGLRLSSYLATDWDQRIISAAGTPYTISYYLSDPCIYYWSAKNSGGTPVGSFQDGINRTQNAVWIAPSTPGTYTITLMVTDQENANKAASDANSRDDDNRGIGDAPLTFQLIVTVL